MSTQTAWQYPADLIDFARQTQILDYLEPIREMTLRLFPTLNRLRISREVDPLLPEMISVVIEAHVPACDVADDLDACQRWDEELYAIYPHPRLIPIVFLLRIDE